MAPAPTTGPSGPSSSGARGTKRPTPPPPLSPSTSTDHGAESKLRRTGGGTILDHASTPDHAATRQSPSAASSSSSPHPPPQPFVCLPYHGEHKRAVSSVAFAPTSSSSPFHESTVGYGSALRRTGTAAMCASASADGTVKLWDVTHAMLDKAPKVTPAPNAPNSRHVSPQLTLLGHSRGINDVSWSPTAEYIATASDDKTLRLWDARTGDALVEFRGHTNFVFALSFNPQSNLLVSGSFDETVKLWDVRSGDCVSTLPAHSDPVTGVDFNRDGTCIVSGSHDGLIRIWDTATGECLKTIYAEGNPPVSYVTFSPNGKYVLSGTLDSKLRLWHVAAKSGGTAGAAGGSGKHQHAMAGAGGGAGQTTQHGRGGKCTKTYVGHTNSKYCIFSAFSVSNPLRQCIVSGSEDGKIFLYDLQSRLVRQVLTGHSDAVLAVAAHDRREVLASGGMTNDKTVKFWAPALPEKKTRHYGGGGTGKGSVERGEGKLD